MKNNISLDINHPQKKRVEYFLNNVDGNLEQIPFNAQELKDVNDILAGFKFKVKEQSTFVTVIFAESYFRADEISEANSLSVPNTKWTINGEILFGVESTDEEVSNKMLSFFAGEE